MTSKSSFDLSDQLFKLQQWMPLPSIIIFYGDTVGNGAVWVTNKSTAVTWFFLPTCVKYLTWGLSPWEYPNIFQTSHVFNNLQIFAKSDQGPS